MGTPCHEHFLHKLITRWIFKFRLHAILQNTILIDELFANFVIEIETKIISHSKKKNTQYNKYLGT